MILNTLIAQELPGTWLMIPDESIYSAPMCIEFANNQILHYELLEPSPNGTLEKKRVHHEKLSDTKLKMVSEHRIRFYRIGNTLKTINDTTSKTEHTVFEIDYERIEPTKTTLTAVQMQTLEFEVLWNHEQITFIFNTILDSKPMQEINISIGKEGRKMVLVNLQSTYFAAMYNDGKIESLLPIREIDAKKIVLYGFPKEPFEVVGLRVK